MSVTAYRLFVFDFDGTLADTGDCVTASFAVALARNGLPPVEPARIVALMGRSLPEVFRELTGIRDAERVEQLVADYRGTYRLLVPERTKAFPGVLAALEQLTTAGVVCTVATSKKTEFARISARHLGLDRYLRLYIGDDLVTRKKPDPEMLERTLTEIGSSVADAVMIGDATTDIEMGQAIGMDTIAVTWGAHSRDQLLAAGPTHIIGSAAELPRFG
jgi:phosphoglycolate phosphatase